MKYNRILYIICIVFIHSYNAFSQVHADFTTSTATSGCSPVEVTFLDASTGNITYRNWIFGNGNFTSTGNLTTAYAIYGTPGSYTVTLIVSDGINYDTIVKTDYIRVFSDPVSGFISLTSTAGCNPLSVDFQNTSTSSDGAITYYGWGFGDGTGSNDINPTHVFLEPGSFKVILHVITEHNCYDVEEKIGFVNVSATPIPAFNAIQTNECYVPFTAIFDNNSTGIGPMSYSWNFGDGSISTSANPVHTYSNFNTYDVSLIVADVNGCEDTLVRENYISIENVVANFNTAKSIYCVDEDVFFENISTGGDQFLWNFGDGSPTDTAKNPSHSYNHYGDYTVKLICSTQNGLCSDTITKIINVERIEAAFTLNPSRWCEMPVDVNFTDQSINAVSWNWDMGYHKFSTISNPIRMTSTEQNPTKTFYYTVFDSNPYYYERDIRLITTSQHGCIDTSFVEEALVVTIPKLNTYPYNRSGCFPMSFQFIDSCTYNSSFDNLAYRLWTFFDGSTSSQMSVLVTPPDTGVYSNSLTIQTSLGCVYNDYVTISTGLMQSPGFIIPENSVCANDSFELIDNSTDTTFIDSYWWSFHGDTTFRFLGSHIFANIPDTGFFDLSYTINDKGCDALLLLQNAIYIKGPIGEIKSTLDCSSPLNYSFNPMAKGVESWMWDFGDGTKDSTNLNPTHTFTRGDYDIKLDLYNSTNNCSYTDSTYSIKVRDVKSVINTDTTYGCPGLVVKFMPDSCQDEDEFCYPPNNSNSHCGNYLWNYGDNSTFPVTGQYQVTDFSVEHTFLNRGTFTSSLIVEDVNGCKDTSYKKIIIYQPQPEFSTTFVAGCKPFDVPFINNSVSDTVLVSWHWDFGNGDTSNIQNPTATYDEYGKYSVSLISKDVLGCMGVMLKPDFISVQTAAPSFTTMDSTLCTGDSVVFINTTPGNDLQFLWEFGDGNTSNIANPVYLYSDTGSYNVSLKVVDTVGCDTTFIKVDYIKYQSYPQASFSADNLSSECYPLIVHFMNGSTSPFSLSWSWDFGDYGVSELQNPIHSFSRPGLFDVKLISSTSFGCKDSMVKDDYIDVKGPYAEFSFANHIICNGATVDFIVDSMLDVVEYYWDFGDGITDSLSGDSVSHTYLDYGTLYPQLVVASDSLDPHTCQVWIKDTIKINFIKSDFSIYDSILCEQNNILFLNDAVGANQFSWNFGDSITSTNPFPFHTYDTPGTYTVYLTVKDEYDCTDTDSLSVVVNPKPELIPIIDTVKCDYSTITLDAGAGFADYQWSTGENTQAVDVILQGRYTVMVKNTEGCWSAIDTVMITNIPTPAVELGNDTLICEGSSIIFYAPYSVFHNYTWSNGSTDFYMITDQPAEYYVTVSSDCGVSNDSVLLEVVPIPHINLGTDTAICTGTSLTLHANGSPYDSYQWNDLSNSDSLIVDSANSYSVIVSNLCFTAGDDIYVDLIPIPSVSFTDDTICEGTTINLGVPYSIYHEYLWNTGATTDSIIGYPDSLYYIKINSDCGVDSDSVFIAKIPLPVVNLGVDTAICTGTNLTLFATGSQYDSYLWNDNTTADSLIADTIATYSVTVSNSCAFARDTITFDLIPIPNVSFIDDTICEGTTITLYAPYSIYHEYLWNTGATIDSIIGLPDSLYSVTVSNVCDTSSDSIFIEKIPLPVVNLGVDTAICTGTSLTLFATGSQYDSYLWNDNTTADSLIADTIATYSVTVTNSCATASDSITFDLIPIPSVSFVDDTICEGTTINLGVSYSIYHEYLWNTGATTDSITGFPDSLYYVKITSDCGVDSDSVFIEKIPLPVVNLGVDTAICTGTSIMLFATDSQYDLYLWNDSTTLDSLVADTIATYSVTVTNSCATASDSITFDLIPIPNVQLGNDTLICEGTTWELDPGGSIYNTYIWNNDSSVQIQIVDTISYFSVTVTNICGTSADSINIGLKPNPVISLGNDTTFCENSSMTINWVSGYADYYWNDSLIVGSYNISVTDTLSLMVRDSVGCFSSVDTIVITAVSPATANLGVDTTICIGDSLLLTANAGYDSYSWNNGSVEDSIYVLQSGTYSVEVKNACNTASDTMNLIVYEVNIDLGLDTIMCPSETITLDAGQGFTSYLWNDNSTGQTLTVSETGIYYVSVTNLCAFVSDTVDVLFLPNSVNLGPDKAICEGEKITFYTPDEFDNYTWHNGFNYPAFTTSKPGTYFVSVENKCGIFTDTVVLAIKPIPTVELGPDIAVSFETETLDAGDDATTYLWSTGDTSSTIQVTAGNYVVWVEVDKDGCKASDTIRILNSPYDSGCIFGVPNAFTPNGDGKNDVLHVRGYCIEKMEFMVFNRFGEMVFKSENINDGWDGTYKGRLQESEVYIWYLKVTLTDGQTVEKTGNVGLLN